MSPKTLKSVLTQCMKAKLPVLIKGAPGVGKSDIVKQVAKRLKMNLVLTHPVVSDPTDFKGLPGIVNGKAEFLPFGDLRKLLEATEPTICFLDDLGQAPACVQAAAMQLILARQVNGHKVSDAVVFVAATNRREDRAGVTGILEPVKSRFATILELEPDADEWTEWALKHKMPPAIIGFVHFKPSLLNTKEATSDIVNHPCPRTIAHAGLLIKAGLDKIEVLSGAVGAGCATELIGFMRVYEQLPTIAAILLDPKEAIVPNEPSALYAIVSTLVDKINDENADKILIYGNRLPKEFSILLGRDVTRKDKTLANCKAFKDWILKHKDVLI